MLICSLVRFHFLFICAEHFGWNGQQHGAECVAEFVGEFIETARLEPIEFGQFAGIEKPDFLTRFWRWWAGGGQKSIFTDITIFASGRTIPHCSTGDAIRHGGRILVFSSNDSHRQCNTLHARFECCSCGRHGSIPNQKGEIDNAATKSSHGHIGNTIAVTATDLR